MKTAIPAVKSWHAIIIGILIPAALPAQDTLRLSLPEAENLFLQKNFLLLAAKYQVSVSDAAIIQAKLYPNPTFYLEQGAYNQQTHKLFEIVNNAETQVNLNQVIILAGKRNKEIGLARMNSQLSTYQFYDLIRTLRYTLRSSFYSLYFLAEPMSVYDREIESLKVLIAAYTDQYNKGNIAFKELARLQALQFSLQNERLDLTKQLYEKQKDISLLIGDTSLNTVKPTVDPDYLGKIDAAKLNFPDLIDSALASRYDLKAANMQVRYGEANLALQKAMRVPDITVGANFDRAGSYIPNYNALSVQLDLPFWNRNQGNIKAAKSQIELNKQLQSEADLQVRNEVATAYRQLLETDKLYQSASRQLTADYDKLLDGIIRGYQNHTISLLEFIDYYETYKNSKLEFNRLQNNRLDALENLNLATGTIILK